MCEPTQEERENFSKRLTNEPEWFQINENSSGLKEHGKMCTANGFWLLVVFQAATFFEN